MTTYCLMVVNLEEFSKTGLFKFFLASLGDIPCLWIQGRAAVTLGLQERRKGEGQRVIFISFMACFRRGRCKKNTSFPYLLWERWGGKRSDRPSNFCSFLQVKIPHMSRCHILAYRFLPHLPTPPPSISKSREGSTEV